MDGDMWVESEVGNGSNFFFTIKSEISDYTRPEAVTSKMAPFLNRTILYVDTLGDKTCVRERIEELGLRAHQVQTLGQVVDKTRLPYIDTIVVDSLAMVCGVFSLL